MPSGDPTNAHFSCFARDSKIGSLFTTIVCTATRTNEIVRESHTLFTFFFWKLRQHGSLLLLES